MRQYSADHQSLYLWQIERVRRLAPAIQWPEVAYANGFDQQGTFLRTFFEKKGGGRLIPVDAALRKSGGSPGMAFSTTGRTCAHSLDAC